MHLCLSLEIALHPPQLPFSPFCYLTQPHPSISPLSPSVICSSLIMNPTGVLFIRQAGEERPVSQADPATLSSLGIWHRNFNRKATQAGRSVQETHCACQSELTDRREHSKCAALLAWQFVTIVEEEKGDGEGMKGKWESGGKGIWRDNSYSSERRGKEVNGGPRWQGPGGKPRQSLPCLSC